MAITLFKFTPVGGLTDKTAFPTYPTDETQARLQFQTPLNQLRDFINDNLIANMGTWNTFKESGGNIGGSIQLGTYTDTENKTFDTRRSVNGKGIVGRFGTDETSDIGAASIRLVEYPTGDTVGSLLVSNTSVYSVSNLDLGNATVKWKDGYFKGVMNVDGIANIGGDANITGTTKVGADISVSTGASGGLIKGLNNKPLTISVVDSSDATVNSVVLDTTKALRPSSTMKELIDIGSATYKFKDGNFSGAMNVGATSKASTGYNQLNNGLLEQWGNISVPSATTTAVTLPIAFTSACYNVQLTMTGSTNITATPTLSGLGKTGFSITQHHSTAITVHWRAVGL